MLEEEESVNSIRQLTEQFDEVSDETAVETQVYTAPFWSGFECKISGAASLLGHPCLEICKYTYTYMVWGDECDPFVVLLIDWLIFCFTCLFCGRYGILKQH